MSSDSLVPCTPVLTHIFAKKFGINGYKVQVTIHLPINERMKTEPELWEQVTVKNRQNDGNWKADSTQSFTNIAVLMCIWSAR